MSSAHQIIEDYFRRTCQPRDSALDAAFQYQRLVLRDLLSRLEAILADEGVESAVAGRVIRCMLYGSPSYADAELRMQQVEETAKMLADRPPITIASLGLPPDVSRRFGRSEP